MTASFEMSGGWWCVGVPLYLIVAGIIIFWMGRRIGAKYRAQLRAQEPQTDVQFLARIAADPSAAEIALMIRSVLAEQCKIERGYIRSDMAFQALHGVMFDGWDEMDLVFRLEKKTNKVIHRDVLSPWTYGKIKNVGEFTKIAAEVLFKEWRAQTES